MKPLGAPRALQISLRRSAELVLTVFIVDIVDNDKFSQSFSLSEGIVSHLETLDCTEWLSVSAVSASRSLNIGRNKLLENRWKLITEIDANMK